MKLRKKITAVFLGLALLSIVAGFCDSLIDSASAMSPAAMDENFAAPNGQMHYSPSAILIHEQQAMPYDNSLKPCCVDKHTGVPTTQTANFNAGVKLLPLGITVAAPNLTSFFENKLNSSSDPSPPKPDELSSVLRLE